MEKMTLNDLNTILSQSVDISTNNYINTDLKTSIINQDLSNNDLVPSIQNAILLKNKYEVLKVDKDFNGTLEDLMRQQGKKIPTNLPFVNILLVGGGSSGGWISGGTTGYTSPNENNNYWIGSGIAGEICWCPNIKIFTLDTKMNITIGKGGESKSREIWKTGSYENDSEQFLPNAGESSYIKWNDYVIRAFGGYENYLEIKDNIITENRVGGLSSTLPFEGDNYYKIIVPCNKGGSSISYNSAKKYYDFYNEYDLEKVYNNKYQKLYYDKNINHNNSPLFPIEPSIYKYIGNIGINMIVIHKEWHQGNSSDYAKTHTYQYLIQNSCPVNNLEYVKKYLENIRISLKNRPKEVNDEDSKNRFTYNEYGVYQNNPGRWDFYKNYDCIFFDGLDANNYGMSGLSGSRTAWNPRNADDELIGYYQRGYMGKGGDGVCYIYYPKEV